MAYATNNAKNLFTVTTGTANDWKVSIHAVGIYDALTGGNLLWVRELAMPASRPLGGATISIPAGLFDINLPSASSNDVDTTEDGALECLRGLITGHFIGLLTRHRVTTVGGSIGSEQYAADSDPRDWNELIASTAVAFDYVRVSIGNNDFTYDEGTAPN